MVHTDYNTIVDVVVKDDILPYYNAQYKIFLDYNKDNYMIWVDYLLDRYNGYNHTGFTVFESKINALSDGVEAMIEDWNQKNRAPLEDDDIKW